MPLAPIALFVYNRPEHAQQTVDALKKNYLSGESELFIFSDAPKDKKAEEKVSQVRGYIKDITGFKKVEIVKRDSNFGLAQSIIRGVSELIAKYGKIIVLEDDLVTSPYFLQFMNDALLFYEKDEKVISVCGYTYPIETEGQETFFLKIADCWGWATWKRGWDLFEPDANKLLKELRAKSMLKRLNLDGAYNYSKMLKKQTTNRASSWAILWYSSALLNEKLSLYPFKSLVTNIGFDKLGTHCRDNSGFFVDIHPGQVVVSGIPLEENQDALKKIKIFFRINRFRKLGCFVREFLMRRPGKHV
jgi:hypothetical protein